MNLVSIILVAMGLLALCGSLLPLTRISHYATGQQLGWRIIYVLNIFFILGYLYFLTYLWSATSGLINVVLSVIFWGGGVFVFLVSKMSLSSLECIQQAAADYEKQALHDALTGLPNRKQLFYVLANTYAARGRDNDEFSVMVMDLNGFKEINDTLGHHAGDRALQLLAPRLKSQLRSSDTLCRLGGDEFAVVLPKTSSHHALPVAQKILKAMEDSFEIEQHNMLMGISIGIASCPEHSENVDTLIQFADIAMYQAKKNRTGVELYLAAQDSHSLKKLNTPHLLQKTINQNQLNLRYQPICDHNTVSGMDVFIQWPSVDDKKLSTLYCMSQVENMGLGKKVNLYILHKALSQYSQWQKQYDFKLHLNLIWGDMLTQGFSNLLKEELEFHGVKASNLVLEIPEPALKSNDSSIRENLKSLGCLGVKLSIKNFGGQGAGLLLIKDTAIQEIKLDRVYSQNLTEEKANQAIIQAADVFFQRLGITMIVDGIETKNDIKTLKDLGVHRYQGMSYCPPLKEEDVSEALVKLSQ